MRDGVAAATGLAPDLKWPNDLLVGRRKLAGILALLGIALFLVSRRGLQRDGRVLLIRNRRYAVGQTLIELPAGTPSPAAVRRRNPTAAQAVRLRAERIQ